MKFFSLKKTSNINSSYPAIFYLYGLGDVEQDYDKAYELFSYSEDKIDDEGIPDQAYIAYMNFKGMGVEQNQNKGKDGEIQITDAIQTLINTGSKFVGHKFSGHYLDCGSMKGYIKSSIEISNI